MATPSTPVNPFKKSVAAKNTAPSTAVNPLKKGAQPAAANPWQPVLSFGQTLIDIASTPLYFVEGGIAAAQKGKNPIVGAAENSVAWANGQRPATGSDILKNAGMSNDFWSSLAADIALDPLTYTPGVVVSAPIKAVLAGVRYGLKGAGAVLTKRVVSETAAKLTKAETKGAADVIAPKGMLNRKTPYNAKQLEKVIPAEAKMQKIAYTPVELAGNRSVSQALTQMLASGLEAGYKGARVSVEKSLLKHDIEKIARKDARAALAGKLQKIIPTAPKILDDVISDATKIAENTPATDITPAQVVADAANVSRAQNIPVIDSAPIKVSPLELDAIQKPMGTATAKAYQARLDKLDKFIKTVKVSGIKKEEIVKSVDNALGSNVQKIYKFFADSVGKNPDVIKNIDAAIRDTSGVTDPVKLLKQYADSQDPLRNTIVKALSNTVVGTHNGAPLLVKDLVASTDNVALDGSVRATLNNLLLNYVNIAKGGDAAITKQNMDVVSGILGREMALKVGKTGAFDPTVATDVAKLKQILDDMPEIQSKQYNSPGEFFDGIKAGHNISKDVLEKVMRLIDPEAKQMDALDNAITSQRSTEVLKTALLTTGVTTVNEIRRNLRLLDTEKFLSQTKMSSISDVAFITDSGVLDALKESDTAVAFSTREEAGKRLVATREAGNGESLNMAADSIGRAMSSQYGSIFRATEKDISRLGQYFSRSYREDGTTEAFLDRIASQYLETKMVASLLAKKTFRRGLAEDKAIRQGVAYIPDDPEAALLEFVKMGSDARDIFLAQYGVRVTHVKSVAATKGLKENAYHHYIDVSDVGELFLDKDHELFMSLMMPSVMHPSLTINPKMDSISFQVIGDIVSDVLRGAEKGTNVDQALLLKRLSTPSPGKTWSADFKKLIDENGAKFIDFMTSTENAQYFAELQKGRVKAELLDLREPAQKFSSAMVDTILGAIKAANDNTIVSQMDRDKAVYEWMLKFAAIADIFAFSNGNVAREMFRSTARLFLQLGDTGIKGVAATEYRLKLQELANLNPNDSEIYADIMKAFESYPKWNASVSSQIKDVSKGLVDNAEKLWGVAKSDFDNSLKGLTTDMNPAQITEWYKGHKVIEDQLNKARAQMGKAGIETDYWNGEAWVSSERFNRRAALKALEKMPNRFIYTKSGTIDISKYLVDGNVVTPTFKQYGKRHTAETRKIYEDMEAARRSVNTKNDKANAQETVMGKADQFEALLPNDPAGQVSLMNDETSFLRHDEAQIKVSINTGVNPETMKQAEHFLIATTYDTAKTEAGSTLGSRFAQKMQGGAGFRDLAPIMANAESTMHNAVAGVAEVLSHTFKFFRENKMQIADMDEALDAAVNKTTIDAVANPNVAQLTESLAGVYDAVTQHAIDRGLSVKMIHEAFKLLNIDKFVPWDQMKSAHDIHKIIGWLPIGNHPAYVEQGLQSGIKEEVLNAKVAMNNYQEAKKAWVAEQLSREETSGSMALFQRAMSAVQRASSEANISSQLVEDFNYMNYFPGMSKQAAYEAALASKEFVHVKAKSGSSFSRWFAKEDNLFQKDIAKQIGAFDRHYNYMSENHMAKFVQNSLVILGVFKTTQTTLRPGHLFNTTIGDTIMSLMRGSNPLLIPMASDIAMSFAGEKAIADWSKSAGAKRLALLDKSLSGLSKRDYAEAASGYTFPIDGKPATIDKQTLTDFLFNYGGLRTNIVANDEVIQMTEFQAFKSGTDQATSYNKMMLEKLNAAGMGANAKRIWLTATKPAGDAVAAAGNIPRVLTALDVMKKGNYKSWHEMGLAVQKELTTYHPMIESLSAFERQKIRPLASYYTWLKGAHYAVLKMSMDHTRTLLIPSKVFYNQALANEMGPTSIGNLWGNKNDTPSYLNYSTYGPTMQGPRGGIVYRPAVPLLDITDTWNIQFDPTKAMDKQAFDNLNSVGQSVIGKNINMVFQPGIEWITGTDPSTGKPSTVKDLQTAGDSLLSNIGTMQLLQGLGLYTAPGKGPESKNPTTERDRFLKLFNYGFGMRVMDTKAPSAVKNAQTDFNARLKRIREQLLQQGQ